jgi:aryl-alcohol dehydrogenase-like predicted oxidoreductase
MQYTTLGSSGVKISRIALGCMSFGDTSRGFKHLADADAALDVTLSDDEIRALEEHYTPRQPTGY